MTNPFDDPNGTYRVLANEEGHHCLWPETISVPPGWHTTRGAGSRAECLDFINQNWVDLRPASLVSTADADR